MVVVALCIVCLFGRVSYVEGSTHRLCVASVQGAATNKASCRVDVCGCYDNKCEGLLNESSG